MFHVNSSVPAAETGISILRSAFTDQLTGQWPTTQNSSVLVSHEHHQRHQYRCLTSTYNARSEMEFGPWAKSHKGWTNNCSRSNTLAFPLSPPLVTSLSHNNYPQSAMATVKNMIFYTNSELSMILFITYVVSSLIRHFAALNEDITLMLSLQPLDQKDLYVTQCTSWNFVVLFQQLNFLKSPGCLESTYYCQDGLVH